MQQLLAFLAEQPILLLALLLGLGAALGHLQVGGVRLGPAAVLFAAIAISSLGAASHVTLAIPEVVGTLGLVLFTYTVGVISGPNFFASLRRGWRTMVTMAAVLVGVALAALGVGRALGLSTPVIAGSFAGALTNTPALAAASARAGDPVGPTIGYSITYLWGVVGMLLAAAWALRHQSAESRTGAPIVHLTIRVERTDSPQVEDLEERYGGRVAVSRLKHGHFASPTLVAEPDEPLGYNDLATVVGPKDVVLAVAAELGHVSSHNIVADRRELDYRRVTLSNSALAGRMLGEIDVDTKFGATVSRIRRADVDLVAHDEFVVQMGDRLRVIAPTTRMAEVSAYLGDSDRGMSDINPGGFALGLGLGLALGLVHIPLPGGGFTLGAAAGTLLVGLVFGRLGRIGAVVTSMSNGAATALSNFGMITFLAYAGTRAGERFMSSVTSGLGWRVAALGFVLTDLAALGILLVVARLHRTRGATLAGISAGTQTQPAILAFANERSGFDTRVGLGYALVYPAAMIVKIILAQVLAGLG